MCQVTDRCKVFPRRSHKYKPVFFRRPKVKGRLTTAKSSHSFLEICRGEGSLRLDLNVLLIVHKCYLLDRVG